MIEWFDNWYMVLNLILNNIGQENDATSNG